MNDRNPGLPNYTGPNSGMFYGVHHDRLFEYSRDINERLTYIDNEKPQRERTSRRRHICLMLQSDADIPDSVWAESAKLWAESDKLWAESAKLLLPYRAQLETAWLRLVPDNRWDGREIVFDRD